MKFGGTSVGSIERISRIANKVVKYVQEKGENVVIVVSAMGGETDELANLAERVSSEHRPEREMHQLLAAGEQKSAALLAMAIEGAGIRSRSFLAYQLGLHTKGFQGCQLIHRIDGSRLELALKQGYLPVVAGFQGVNSELDLTTLGRGGSDASAVAIAARLKARKCFIYTDVDGVYTASPLVCRDSRKLSAVTYREMLELAGDGAKVLQARSVRLAKKYSVTIEVASSGMDRAGTEIVESYENMEDTTVSGITFRSDQAKVTLENVPDRPGVAAEIFGALAGQEVTIDMIVQSQGADGETNISFTLSEAEILKAEQCLTEYLSTKIPRASLKVCSGMAKLSVVGEGIQANPGVAAKMFEVLGREGINIDMISTSEIKISVALEQKYAELAVRALHSSFFGDLAPSGPDGV